MCGIVGIQSFTGSIQEDKLQAAIKSLNHRGPEGDFIWMDARKSTGLAHSRLSIIDLKTGNQPISNENNKIHIVVNGEFYDFERIRTELEAKGHQFKTKSDSEIALHLYEDMGASCLANLRGEFAFIIWDEESKVLIAARDRFGIKPLFYSIFDGKIYIASEVKALFAAGVPPAWDHASINMSFPHKTVYKHVYQVPPGHFIQVIRDNCHVYKYWDFNYPTADSSLIYGYSLEETVAMFKAKLEEAVRLRLRADVPVAVYLSGGLDSSALLGMASAMSDKPLTAFSLSFDHPQYDESSLASDMAQQVNSPLNVIKITQQDLVDNLAKTIWHGEQPLINANSVAKYLLSSAVRKAGFKVVLTGEGSDEILAGYPAFRMDMLQQASAEGQLTEQQEALIKQNQASLGLILANSKLDLSDFKSVKALLGFLPAWLCANIEFASHHNSLFADVVREKLNISYSNYLKLMLNQFDIEGQLKNRDILNQSLYLWSKTLLAQYLLSVLGDRMEMANSVEGRVPFLDHHLVEFMRHVPTKFKIYHMSEKYLLREAAKNHLTKAIYERQKHPFLAPPALLTPNGVLFKYICELMTSSSLPNFYDRKKIINLLNSIPTMDPKLFMSWDPVLMMIASNCLLQEQFKLS